MLQAGTLRATVQLFPLRQNGASDPKIKEIFPKINELTATLKPWVRIIVDVFNSEDERSPKDKGCDQTEEKNDENDWTQLDSSSKSDKKNYRVVNGFMDKDTILPDLICCVDNERTGTQASIWTRSADKQVHIRTERTCIICRYYKNPPIFTFFVYLSKDSPIHFILQIIISFRGTQEPEDILADLNFVPVRSSVRNPFLLPPSYILHSFYLLHLSVTNPSCSGPVS